MLLWITVHIHFHTLALRLVCAFVHVATSGIYASVIFRTLCNMLQLCNCKHKHTYIYMTVMYQYEHA